MTDGRKVGLKDGGGIKDNKGEQEAIWEDENVQYLGYGGGFSGVYICQNSSSLYFKYVQLILHYTQSYKNTSFPHLFFN